MKEYELGETAICYLEIKKTGAYYDPATSVKATIYGPSGAVDTAATSMTKEDTGKYSYDYQTSGKTIGKYKVLYTITDGTKITTARDYFKVVVV